MNFAVEIVKKGIQRASPPVQRALDTISRQRTRLSRLTELIVAASEHAEGKPPLRREQLDLAGLVRDVARDYEDLFKREGCELRLSADEPVAMKGDAIGLEVVISNIFGNAMKFGAHAPIDVFVRGTDETAKRVAQLLVETCSDVATGIFGCRHATTVVLECRNVASRTFGDRCVAVRRNRIGQRAAGGRLGRACGARVRGVAG